MSRVSRGVIVYLHQRHKSVLFFGAANSTFLTRNDAASSKTIKKSNNFLLKSL